MRRKISTVLFALLFLAGFGIMAYPTIADQWNTYRQSRLITDYEEVVNRMEPEDFTREWETARSFNAAMAQNNLYGDVFGESSENPEDSQYWKTLNIAGDGIMGYLTIPKINVRLAVYHGTSDEVLQTGIGHLNGTKLPIGGASTHSVLAAHRGLPSAKLFTDIDQLEERDRFYIHILDEDLAYEVDLILPMVDKDDHETLEGALQIEEGKDQVTLFTCTPYGVNSHRLLVRGHRVPYDGELESTPVDSMVQAIRNYYMLYLLMGTGLAVLGIMLVRRVMRKKPTAEKNDETENREEGKS